jgi:hypothetical protein
VDVHHALLAAAVLVFEPPHARETRIVHQHGEIRGFRDDGFQETHAGWIGEFSEDDAREGAVCRCEFFPERPQESFAAAVEYEIEPVAREPAGEGRADA